MQLLLLLRCAISDSAAIHLLLIFHPFHSNSFLLSSFQMEFKKNGIIIAMERALYTLSARFIIELAASHSLMTIWYAINVFDLLTPFVMLQQQSTANGPSNIHSNRNNHAYHAFTTFCSIQSYQSIWFVPQLQQHCFGSTYCRFWRMMIILKCPFQKEASFPIERLTFSFVLLEKPKFDC